jgi:hypothetical protein
MNTFWAFWGLAALWTTVCILLLLLGAIVS